MENNVITVRPDTGMGMVLSPANIRAQVNLIQEVMKEVMTEGIHYGVIPGCGKKPSLFKPGAEKLSLVFRLRPIINEAADIQIVELPNGHREVRTLCHILNADGLELATGVGSCSTMEKKYRYRNVADYEETGEPIPKDSKEKKQEYRKQGFGMRKVNEEWCWVKFNDAAPVENPDIADTYNTVLKMSKKRAYIDGMLSATAASDLYTQDIEDLPAEVLGIPKEQAASDKKAAASAPAPHQHPQRKSEQTNLTHEELAAKEAKAKEALHSGDKPAGTAPAQETGLATATGFLTGHGEPNAGGYVAWSMEGQQREDGKDAKFASNDMEILNILTEKMEAGEKVTLEYKPSTNPRFAHNIVSVKQGIAETK